MTTTTTPNGGGGTTTTDPTGGGGTGGTTTTITALPTSCQDAKDKGATGAKLTEIDPDGDVEGGVEKFEVFCDQEKDGGGWALLYNSVGKPAGGTTAFWNIPYADRLGTKGTAALDENYYAGALYKFGKEYRDDAVDEANTEVLGIMRATANGINEVTMKLTQPVEKAGSLSSQIYSYHFFGGWSASDYDGDSEDGNCAVTWANVTQHYAGCWKYSLGADATDKDPDAVNVDYTDGGWGPHIINLIIADINTANAGNPALNKFGADGASTRMKRISRFTRW